MEDTLALVKFADKVTVIHRRDSFRASKIMQDRVLNNPKVNVIWNTGVKEIIGEQKVESLVLEDLNTKQTSTVPADGIFVAVGHKPSTSIFQNQIALDDKGFVLTRLGLNKQSVEMASNAIGEHDFVQFPTMTSVEGVFGAGDVVDFRYKQAITASAYGTMAALDCQWWLEQQ
jgi:thioredoxin reductase (NADPH)